MPAYNHEKYIGKAIESVLMQKTSFPVKLYISDDASTDRTFEIVNSYHSTSNIEIFAEKQSVNIGAWANGEKQRKYAAESGYKYVAILEGDDYWTDSEKLQQQFNFLESNKEIAIYCGHARTLKEGEKEPGARVHPQIESDRIYTLEDFTENSFIVTCTALSRNTGLNNIPEQIKSTPAADWFLWVHIMQSASGNVYYANRDYGVYRVHQGGIFSMLDREKQCEYYIKSLKTLAGLFLRKELKERCMKNRHWYLTEVFRIHLREGKKFRALRDLWTLLRQGTAINRLIPLLHEWIINRQVSGS